jgi:hypothetical protein
MKISALILMLVFSSFILQAQDKGLRIVQLTIAYSGDSTLFTEKYEIDLVKGKVFYITPIMNYLDIKGVKYRTRRKIKKTQWLEIVGLIENYNFSSLDSLNVEGLKDQDYSIEVSRSNKESKNYTISNRDVPQIIKKLFKIIRN